MIEDKLEGTNWQTAHGELREEVLPHGGNALRRVTTFRTDRDVIARAVRLVRETYAEVRAEEAHQPES
jgi:hypothetical protein